MKKISIIGTRGIPAKYGGFETFAEEISRSISKIDSDIEMTVVSDLEQKKMNQSLSQLENIKIIYSKYSKDKNPLLYYFDSIMLSKNQDVILSCGLGGGYFSFLTKFTKVKFITNPDGLEWKRSKWSKIKKVLLKTMEWFSVKYSDFLVCDSEGITDYIKKQYNYKNKLYTIEYGAYVNNFLNNNSEKVNTILDTYNLKSNCYHLIVSRLEPENNVDMIIKGYLLADLKYPLIIVGNLNSNNYVRSLEQYKSKKVIFIGGIYEKEVLSIIRANALSYLHGHSVGGTNPSLLEAMGSKNLCICHDNIFNRKTVGKDGMYFKNSEDVEKKLIFAENKDNIEIINNMKNGVINKVINKYNWNSIAKKYINMFKEVTNV